MFHNLNFQGEMIIIMIKKTEPMKREKYVCVLQWESRDFDDNVHVVFVHTFRTKKNILFKTQHIFLQ